MEPFAVMRFPNGTTMDVVVNGNTYGAYEEPDFPEDMTEVTVNGNDIFGGDVNWSLHNPKVVQSAQLDDYHHWFGLVEQW